MSPTKKKKKISEREAPPPLLPPCSPFSPLLPLLSSSSSLPPPPSPRYPAVVTVLPGALATTVAANLTTACCNISWSPHCPLPPHLPRYRPCSCRCRVAPALAAVVSAALPPPSPCCCPHRRRCCPHGARVPSPRCTLSETPKKEVSWRDSLFPRHLTQSISSKS